MPPDPLLDVPLEHSQLVQCNQDKITWLNLRQIFQFLHKYIGKTVVWQYHIPVVADRDSGGHHPGGVDTLLQHSVQAHGDSGQGLATALLPLEHPIPFLEHPVDVLALNVV